MPWLSQISQRSTLGHTFALDHISNINHDQVGRYMDHINLDIEDNQADLEQGEVDALGYAANRQEQFFSIGTSPLARMGRRLQQFGLPF